MATQTFDFSVFGDPIEWYERPSVDRRSEAMTPIGRFIGESDLFRSEGIVLFFPAPNSAKTFAQWETFYRTHGNVVFFYYKANWPTHKIVTDGALGTGDGSTVIFPFSGGTDLHKYIDLATLVVKVDGVTQTEGAGDDYLVSGNNTDPTITFNAGSEPGNLLAVTVSYEFFHLCKFEGEAPRPQPLGTNDQYRVIVALAEFSPGDRLA